MAEYHDEANARIEMLARTSTLADPRHETYARERFLGASRAKAYAKAYDLNAAQKSLSGRAIRLEQRVPEILLRIDALQKEAAAQAVTQNVIGQEYVREKWVRIVEYGMEPIYRRTNKGLVLDEQGKPVLVGMRDVSAANTALSAMAKSLGMYDSKVRKSSDAPVEMTDEQLLAELERAEKDVALVRAQLSKRPAAPEPAPEPTSDGPKTLQ